MASKAKVLKVVVFFVQVILTLFQLVEINQFYLFSNLRSTHVRMLLNLNNLAKSTAKGTIPWLKLFSVTLSSDPRKVC